MSLRAFEFAEVEEGYLVELARGYIVVSGRVQWKEAILGPDDICDSKLLPAFQLPCGEVFALAASDDGADGTRSGAAEFTAAILPRRDRTN